MYRRILVPTDFSTYADQALEHALQLARCVEAEIVLLHSYLRPIGPAVPAGDKALREHLEEGVRAMSEKLEEKAAACTGVDCRTVLREGKPAEEIVEVAQDEGCDLICLSTAGHGRLAHALVGSVAERVIHRAPCPVLVLKLEKEKPEKVRRARRPKRRLGKRRRLGDGGD